MKKKVGFFNSKGVGLLEIVIASAILILALIGISKFLTGAKSTSKTVSESAACQQVLESLSAEFREDEAAISFSSVGPDENGFFPSGQFQTLDQQDQFSLGGNPVLAMKRASLSGPTDTGSDIPNAGYPSDQFVDLNPSIHPVVYNNHLNIKNTMNRFVAMVNATPEVCVDGLSGEGVELARVSTPLANKYQKSNEKIFLAIDLLENGSSICRGGNPKILRPQARAINAKYKITLQYVDPATNAERTCAMEGRSQFHRDDFPPIVLIKQNYPANYCDTQVAPTRCNGSDRTLNLEVYTVRDTPECQACIARETNRNNCRALTPEIGFTGDILRCLEANGGACLPSDPGSLFYCSFGEKNWLNSSNKIWQPCHQANIFQYDGSASSASVAINYDNQSSAFGAHATISITDFPLNQHVLFDVRAVDTGQLKMGKSYCSTGGHCEITSGNGLVIDTLDFNFGEIQSADNTVAPSDRPPKGGELAVAEQELFPGLYQCQAGTVNIGVQMIGYIAPNSSWGNEVCNNIVFVRGSGTINGCGCDNNGFCNVAVTPNTFGPLAVRFSVSDTCGLVRTQTFNWCRERSSNPNPLFPEGTLGILQPMPTFNPSDDRLCGELVVCPSVVSGSEPNIRLNSCSPADWTINANSGCVEGGGGFPPSTKNSVCMSVIDSCGRKGETQNSPETRPGYGTYLGESSSTSITDHRCGRTDTRTTGEGNVCIAGANYCRSNRHCYSRSSCSYYGVSCTNDPAAPEYQRCIDNAEDCLSPAPPAHGTCSTKYQCRTALVTDTDVNCIENGSCRVMGSCRGDVISCKCSSSGNSCRRSSDCSGTETCVCSCTTNGKCSYAGTTDASSSCCGAVNPMPCPPLNGTCELFGSRGTCSCPSNTSCGPMALSGVVCPDLNSCGYIPPRPSPTPPGMIIRIPDSFKL